MPSDRAFRAQLVTPGQRELYDYWRRSAGTREMPARADLDPASLLRLLPHIGLIDAARNFEDAWVRLAGTGLRDIYGTEITGRRVAEVFGGARADYWRRVHERVVLGRLPVHGVVRGPVEGRDHVILFWLRLPLSEEGSQVDKILCHDVAAPVECLVPAEMRKAGTQRVSGHAEFLREAFCA